MAELSRDDVERLVRIEGTAIRIEGRLDDIGKRLDDHRGRLRSLEHWRWGTGAAIGGVVILVGDSPLAALLATAI